MIRIITVGLFLGLMSPHAESRESVESSKTNSGSSDRWHYAGENHGVRFFFKITNECKEAGAALAVKLESALDYPVTVSFRINDPNWSKTFERDLTPGEKDTGLKFMPNEGTTCHPFVDEIFVEAKTPQLTKSGDTDAATGE